MGSVHIAPDGAGVFKAWSRFARTQVHLEANSKGAAPTGPSRGRARRVGRHSTAVTTLQQSGEKGKAAFVESVNGFSTGQTLQISPKFNN
jgi:hypothetical protein